MRGLQENTTSQLFTYNFILHLLLKVIFLWAEIRPFELGGEELSVFLVSDSTYTLFTFRQTSYLTFKTKSWYFEVSCLKDLIRFHHRYSDVFLNLISIYSKYFQKRFSLWSFRYWKSENYQCRNNKKRNTQTSGKTLSERYLQRQTRLCSLPAPQLMLQCLGRDWLTDSGPCRAHNVGGETEWGEEEGEVLEGFQFLSELLSPNKNGLSLDTSSNFVISQRERESWAQSGVLPCWAPVTSQCNKTQQEIAFYINLQWWSSPLHTGVSS